MTVDSDAPFLDSLKKAGGSFLKAGAGVLRQAAVGALSGALGETPSAQIEKPCPICTQVPELPPKFIPPPPPPPPPKPEIIFRIRPWWIPKEVQCQTMPGYSFPPASVFDRQKKSAHGRCKKPAQGPLKKRNCTKPSCGCGNPPFSGYVYSPPRIQKTYPVPIPSSSYIPASWGVLSSPERAPQVGMYLPYAQINRQDS